MSPAITWPEFRPTRSCSATGSECVVFQCYWGIKDRHSAVAVIFHSPAVLARYHRRAFHQRGHDLAQPFDIDGGRDIHRGHHISE